MDAVDWVLVGIVAGGCLVLGLALGRIDERNAVYQACETRQPLVIEMGGVKQVYACMRVQR